MCLLVYLLITHNAWHSESRSLGKSHTSWNPNPTRASCDDVSNDNFQLPAPSMRRIPCGDYVIGLAMDIELGPVVGVSERGRWSERERYLIVNWAARRDDADKKSTPVQLKRAETSVAVEECILTWANCPDQAQKTNKYHTFVYVHKDKRRQRAARVVSWVCSRVCSSPTVAHARLQFAATYAARSLCSLSPWGDTCQSHSSIFSR